MYAGISIDVERAAAGNGQLRTTGNAFEVDTIDRGLCTAGLLGQCAGSFQNQSEIHSSGTKGNQTGDIFIAGRSFTGVVEVMQGQNIVFVRITLEIRIVVFRFCCADNSISGDIFARIKSFAANVNGRCGCRKSRFLPERAARLREAPACNPVGSP